MGNNNWNSNRNNNWNMNNRNMYDSNRYSGNMYDRNSYNGDMHNRNNYNNYNNNNNYNKNNMYNNRNSFNKFDSGDVQWQNDYNSNHRYACANGQYMTSWKATKQHTQFRDRMFQVGCGGANAADNCTWSNVVNDWNADFYYECPDNKVFTGMSSEPMNSNNNNQNNQNNP